MGNARRRISSLASRTIYPRYFNHIRNMHITTPYAYGIIITPDFVSKNKQDIDHYKNELKKELECNASKDMDEFVDTLFDFTRMTNYIKRIDKQTQKLLSKENTEIFSEYEAAQANHHTLEVYFRNRFLPTLRTVFQNIAEHYKFNSNLIETSNGVILEDDYLSLVKEGKLILDLGEDAHGPFPHLLASFVMKELELDHKISSAVHLYQSLSERSNLYCPLRVNFQSKFYILLDQPVVSGLSMFCNPSSLSNHLLANGETLKSFAAICKKHSEVLMQLASDDWEHTEDKEYLTLGQIRDLACISTSCADQGHKYKMPNY